MDRKEARDELAAAYEYLRPSITACICGRRRPIRFRGPDALERFARFFRLLRSKAFARHRRTPSPRAGPYGRRFEDAPPLARSRASSRFHRAADRETLETLYRFSSNPAHRHAIVRGCLAAKRRSLRPESARLIAGECQHFSTR